MKPRTAVKQARGIDDWQSYLSAAHRKVEIASYHLGCLATLLDTAVEQEFSELPPIDVQAHFEGVLFSVMAAASQVEEAIKRAKGLPPSTERFKVWKLISSCRVKEWYSCALGKDLQALRNAAYHRSYEKARKNECWLVQEPLAPTREVRARRDKSGRYEGSRELRDYCEAAVNYGDVLVELIPELRFELAAAASGRPPS